MPNQSSFTVLREAEPPACLKGVPVCRGCAGWRAMLNAVRPNGVWAGEVIHCACTGLTVKGAS